jgi:hypothetical protein
MYCQRQRGPSKRQGRNTYSICCHAGEYVGKLNGGGLPALQHLERNHGYGFGRGLDLDKQNQQRSTPRQRADHNGTGPGKVVSPQTQAQELSHQPENEDEGPRQIQTLHGGQERVLWVQRRHHARGIFEDNVPDNEGQH